MPKPAPPRRLFHRDWPTARVANSTRGAVLAREQGCGWIDNDFHLSKNGLAWVNAHGSPELFWLARGDRFENHDAAELFARTRVAGGKVWRLRNLNQALADNEHNGLGTEIEVKDVRPWATAQILDAAFARVANHAAAVYGANWRDRVVVKVLTNLGGGEAYALKILAHAHAKGIPTMLLARGACRFKKYADHPEIDYVRGSLVIR